jgi:hypothetical protein
MEHTYTINKMIKKIQSEVTVKKDEKKERITLAK